MNKYLLLLPWSSHMQYGASYSADRVSYRRYRLDDSTSFWIACVYSSYGTWTHNWQPKDDRIMLFTTVELAMKACDKILLDNGYILLTEERAEKLKLLL